MSTLRYYFWIIIGFVLFHWIILSEPLDFELLQSCMLLRQKKGGDTHRKHGGDHVSDHPARRKRGAAKEGRFTEAREKLEQAAEELHKAHRYQTSLIQGEIQGDRHEISFLMIHAQDHLMNAITMKDLANEIVELHESIRPSKG